jgi:hypothetical protein
MTCATSARPGIVAALLGLAGFFTLPYDAITGDDEKILTAISVEAFSRYRDVQIRP